jgi:hypothetical protein
VTTTITVGSIPYAFCWNSTQNRVYVANYDNSSVSVIRDSIISGIEENYQSLPADRFSLEVYPNPTKSFFVIRSPLNTQGYTLRIYDVTGKIVKSEELKGKSNRVSLNGIKDGIYFVKVGNEMVKEKLVITK